MKHVVRTVVLLLAFAMIGAAAGQVAPATPQRPVTAPPPPAPGTATGQPPPQQQAAGKATGIILGRVVDAESGRPIGGALVVLSPRIAVPVPATGGVMNLTPPQNQPPQVYADAQGQFVFRSLVRGSYGFSARASGYAPGSYGQRRPNGPSGQIQLAEDQRKTDVVIRLWRFAAISGIVRDEAGEPAIGVQVTLLRALPTGGRRSLAPGNQTTTDDRGMYRFGGLTAGTYSVYVRQTTTSVPMASVEEFNKPVTGQPAQAARNAMMQDLSMAGLSVGSPGVRVGDQQLQYQGMNSRGLIAPLPGSDGRMFVYQTTFYPTATIVSQATMIALGSGEERSGTDLQLKLVPAYRVSGQVFGPDGPAAFFPVRLQPGGLDELVTNNGFETSTTATDPFGNFTILGVPPGQYTLTAIRVPRPVPMPPRPPPPPPPSAGRGTSPVVVPIPAIPNFQTPPAEPTLFAQQPVSVGDSDLGGVTVALSSGPRLRGRVEFQGSSARPDAARLQQLTVNISPADSRNFVGGFTPARVAPDGTFTTMSYPPGRYYLSIASPGQPWWVRSVTVNGREAIDVPFELRTTDVSGVVVLFTDQTNELSGTVQKTAGPDDLLTAVFLFPANYQASAEEFPTRRIRTTTVGPIGQFMFRNLLPGDYLLAAVHMETGIDTSDPQLMNSVARAATRVTVTDGGKQVITLTPSTIK